MTGIMAALIGSMGDSLATITVSDQSIYDADGSAAYAYYFLTAAGQVEQSKQVGGINPVNLEQWCTPTNQAPNYEVRITVTSGSLTGGSGSGSSWIALSSTRNWYVANTTPTSLAEAIFTVEIRRVGTTTVLDSATITLQAEVF